MVAAASAATLRQVSETWGGSGGSKEPQPWQRWTPASLHSLCQTPRCCSTGQSSPVSFTNRPSLHSPPCLVTTQLRPWLFLPQEFFLWRGAQTWNPLLPRAAPGLCVVGAFSGVIGNQLCFPQGQSHRVQASCIARPESSRCQLHAHLPCGLWRHQNVAQCELLCPGARSPWSCDPSFPYPAELLAGTEGQPCPCIQVQLVLPAEPGSWFLFLLINFLLCSQSWFLSLCRGGGD